MKHNPPIWSQGGNDWHSWLTVLSDGVALFALSEQGVSNMECPQRPSVEVASYFLLPGTHLLASVWACQFGHSFCVRLSMLLLFMPVLDNQLTFLTIFEQFSNNFRTNSIKICSLSCVYSVKCRIRPNVCSMKCRIRSIVFRSNVVHRFRTFLKSWTLCCSNFF